MVEQDKVFLIGNNDAQEYTVLYGEVINTAVDAGDRHSATLQVSYANKGGSSGSPVFSADGKVVGIHYKGTDSTGFELRAEYIKDALAQITAGGVCKRGEIGCRLSLIKLSEAEKHFRLPSDVADKIRATGTDIKNGLCVHGAISCTSADGKLEPGDIVVSVDGQSIGDNMYAFDKLVDAKTGGEVKLDIVRNGQAKEISLKVQDAAINKVDRFARFGGAVIHDLTPELRREYGITAQGVFLAEAKTGTTFDLGGHSQRAPSTRTVVIEAVNGTKTPDLASFVAAVSSLKDGQDINVTLSDYYSLNTSAKAVPLHLNLKFNPLEQYERNADRQWVQKAEKAPGT